MNKILIIEDEKSMAMALEIKLKKVGLDAKAVFDGAEGLKELEAGGYSLVLLDLMMPIMDGWTVLSKIKEKNINVKVIVTSNLSQPEDVAKAKSFGALDFLVKSDTSILDIANKVIELTK